ncbi:hypothetical protein [Endozoicomonas numazuensis]|uniref:Lipoprotein n=1 Tax=Endozoicomonas numazuensis TaxID=1137799 RepID=A0A081NEA9_9GAMM|nr:hypothetical protein [Endozoicomonas numazuensis]KEQ16782.1 hypothetical protein GZ78_19060 [Endozoicomonas numazuensis]
MTAKYLLSVLAGLLLLNIAFAELPPDVYEEWQEISPEELIITVKKVSVHVDENNSRLLHCSVTVVIDDALRSENELSEGSTLKIKYFHRIPEPYFIGPSSIPVLDAGQSYLAYLRKTDSQYYTPSAGGLSFISQDSFQLFTPQVDD